MKKVCIIINNFGIGGAERLVIDDANEFGRRNDVELKILTLKSEGKNSLSDQLQNGSNWECIPFSTLFDIPSYVSLIRHIVSFKPDLVITHLWFANTIGRIVSKIAGAPRIISFEHNVYDTLKTNKMFFIDRLLQSFSFKIIAVSEAVKQSLIRHGIKSTRIEVLRNCISLDIYKKSSDTGRQTLGITNDNFLFMTVARLIHQKGIDVLLKAFARISAPGAVLAIVGEGIDKEKFIQLARMLRIEDRVIFLGIRHDIPDMLGACDCFVLASRYEGLGIVILEAMASGKPIVTTDFEAVHEMIEIGVQGIIVPTDDVETLGKAMETILKQKDLRDALGKQAYKRAQDFSITTHVDRLLSYIG